MNHSNHTYLPPQVTTVKAVPSDVARYLNGADLLSKSQALRLTTVDDAGWPHAALLSAGDAVALDNGRLRFALYPQSATTANLTRDGRLTVSLAVDGGLCELRLRANPLMHTSADVPLAFFEAEVETVRHHQAPYADLDHGVTFTLHDPQAVLARWIRQIAALRSAS